jgi:hypothetical protein
VDHAIDAVLQSYIEEVTNPTRWEELAPFRETFLRYVAPLEPQRILRHLGRLFYQIVLEELPSGILPATPFPRTELQALVADFRYGESFLASVARALLESDAPSKANLELARLLAQECLLIQDLARRLEQAGDRPQ